MISGEAHAELELLPDLALTPLAASSWRSLGGYFNYETWPHRERFLNLDRAIMIAKAQQLEEHPERAKEVAAQLCMPHDEADIPTISPDGTIASRFLSSNDAVPAPRDPPRIAHGNTNTLVSSRLSLVLCPGNE